MPDSRTAGRSPSKRQPKITGSRLRVYFTGLCAHTEMDGKHVIVCPKGHRRFPLSVIGAEPIAVHLPLFTTTSSVKGRSPDSPITDKTAIWFPVRERLQVFLWKGTSPLPPQPVRYVSGGGTAARPDGDPPSPKPKPGNENDVCWIADMAKIWPRRARLRSECLPGGADPAVSMQVIVPGGTLSTAFRKGPYSLSLFKPVKNAEVKQTITQRMAVTLDLSGVTAIQVRSISLDTGYPLDDLWLDVPANGDVEITFANADYSDVQAIAGNEGGKPIHSPDTHFELYYDLLEPEAMSSATSNQLPIPWDADMTLGIHSNCPTLRTQKIS